MRINASFSCVPRPPIVIPTASRGTGEDVCCVSNGKAACHLPTRSCQEITLGNPQSNTRQQELQYPDFRLFWPPLRSIELPLLPYFPPAGAALDSTPIWKQVPSVRPMAYL